MHFRDHAVMSYIIITHAKRQSTYGVGGDVLPIEHHPLPAHAHRQPVQEREFLRPPALTAGVHSPLGIRVILVHGRMIALLHEIIDEDELVPLEVFGFGTRGVVQCASLL